MLRRKLSFISTVKSPVQETAVDLYRSVNDSFGSNLVRYDCTFRGVPRPNVVWYRNGEQIRPNLYLEISNFVFTFILVNKSENAVYKCFGSNEFSEREATFYRKSISLEANIYMLIMIFLCLLNSQQFQSKETCYRCLSVKDD